MKRLTRHLALRVSTLALAASSVALAEPIRFHAGAAAAHAVGGPQQDELSFGAGVQAGAEFMLVSQLSLGVKGMGLWLTPGDPTTDPSIVSERGASLYGGALNVTAYPLASDEAPASTSASGLWLSVAGGAATTGGRVRPTLDGMVGWDVFWPSSTFGLGPTLGLLHVFQPNSHVRPQDANVLMLGLNARFWHESPKPPEPPLDTDRDGIPDQRDSCSHGAEDKDGFEDDDGCPEDGDGTVRVRDGDRDGVADASDKCPDEQEDKDGFQDDDGCSDLDNDEDGTLDAQDLCPNERETLNDYADHDGCPDEDQVRVIGGEIVLDEVVRFPTNSAVISQQSHALLERLAKLVREHPEYIHISIEGHADARGPEAHNEKLSAARAAAVLEFLIKNGVEAQRLSSKGFGSQKPAEAGRDARAFSKNRRVEFVVTRAALPGQGGGTAPNETAPNETAPNETAPNGTMPSETQEAEDSAAP